MDTGIVASSLIEKLRNVISGESSIISSMFKGQVQTAINSLHLLKQSLHEAEDFEASPRHSMSHRWIARLLQAVYSAEDSTDTLLTRTELQQRERQKGNGFNPIMRLKPLFSQIIFTYEMKKLEKEIRGLLSQAHCVAMQGTVVSEIQGVAGNSNSTRSSPQNETAGSFCLQQRQSWSRISSYCLEEETDIVGLERKIHELVVQLIPEDNRIDDQPNEKIMEVTVPEQDHNNDHSTEVIVEVLGQDRDQSTRVIAVVGEGGSGKTTLVRNVYNRLDVKRYFTQRIWVRVSSLFTARDVLVDMIKQVNKEDFMVDDATILEKDLILKLNELLSWSRYLIVIDNVEKSQVWEALRGALDSSYRGSRIIIISRNGNNVPLSSANSIVHTRPLNSEETWKLFLKKVRTEDDVLNNSELITLKEKILNICRGSPLVIVLLGGLLSTKERRYNEWSKVIEHANDVMALSYQNLPSHIKPCFLYMGRFPREYEISVKRLMHLWSAEGFVTNPLGLDEEIVAEDLAEKYFEELVIRNMIQVRWRLDGTPKMCRMHNVLHEVFSEKAANVGFFYHLLQPSSTSAKRPELTIRRLAVTALGNNSFPSSFFHGQHLRSYLAFDGRIHHTRAREINIFLNKISKGGFALLKLLDLEGVYKPVLAKGTVERMLHLKYMGLRYTAIDSLPDCVGKLQCLETLDLKHTNIRNLPPSTWEAKKLRHLYLNWNCSCNFRSLSSAEPPVNLQTIWGLCLSDESAMNFLKGSVRLRRLGLICKSTLICEEIAEYISQLTLLQSLKLRSLKTGQVPHLDSMTEHQHLNLHSMTEHHKLEDLYLYGELRQPKKTAQIDFHHFFSPNLKFLTLSNSKLEEDPMPLLGQLPQLKILKLSGYSPKREEIKCLSGGFPKLHVLKLWNIWYLKEWTVMQGAMPCLRELEMRNCNYQPWKAQITTVTGLQHVTSLKELVLTNMPQTFRRNIARSLLGRNIYIKINELSSSHDGGRFIGEIEFRMNAFDPNYFI